MYNHFNRSSLKSSEKKGIMSSLKKFFGFFVKENKENLKVNLQNILDKYKNDKVFSEVEKQIMLNTLSFGKRRVEDIMIHRTDMVAIEKNVTPEELKKILLESKHTRFPIYEQNLDNILGFIHIKDTIKGIFENNILLNEIMRPITSVTLNLPLPELLVKMRTARVHMAIVIDEYGGVDGLVAFEDVLEEIIGEVYDEHDKELKPDFQVIIEKELIETNGRLSLEVLEKLFDIKFTKQILEDIDTVAGLILSLEGRIPIKYEKILYENLLEFEIVEADNRTIKRAKVKKLVSLNNDNILL